MTRNQVCPLGTVGSNPTLSAKLIAWPRGANAGQFETFTLRISSFRAFGFVLRLDTAGLLGTGFPNFL